MWEMVPSLIGVCSLRTKVSGRILELLHISKCTMTSSFHLQISTEEVSGAKFASERLSLSPK